MKARGFTIAETVFASVLFAFIILFIMNIYPSSMVAIRRAESQIVADNFAQTVLEDLRSRSYYNVDVNAEPYYAPLIYNDFKYNPYLDVFYDPDGTDERFLKIARLEVAWVFQNRENRVVHTMYLHNVIR